MVNFVLNQQHPHYMTTTHDALGLHELPQSVRTLTIGSDFMLSDNLDSSAPLLVLNLPSSLKVKVRSPFKLKFSTMLLCLGGRLDIRLNMMEYSIKGNDILIVPEGAVVECLLLSDDVRIVMLAFLSDFIFNARGNSFFPETFAKVLYTPLIHLEGYETTDIMSIYNMIRKRVKGPEFSQKNEFVISAMKTIFHYISPHFSTPGHELQSEPRASRIFERFMVLLEKHYARERQIYFYANELGMTSKYLSRIVYQTSGKTVKEWISERIILEAKVLLKEGRLSVLEISELLGFPNQSFFGTFFKHSEGISPTAYRRGEQCISPG